MIDITKKYKTRGGYPVRIIATDLKGCWPLLVAVTEEAGSEVPYTLRQDGRKWENTDTPMDLVEANPYEDFVIGEPVMATESASSGHWIRRYFAGISGTGRPMVFVSGATQWSSYGEGVVYHAVRRPTEEELK